MASGVRSSVGEMLLFVGLLAWIFVLWVLLLSSVGSQSIQRGAASDGRHPPSVHEVQASQWIDLVLDPGDR